MEQHSRGSLSGQQICEAMLSLRAKGNELAGLTLLPARNLPYIHAQGSPMLTRGIDSWSLRQEFLNTLGDRRLPWSTLADFRPVHMARPLERLEA